MKSKIDDVVDKKLFFLKPEELVDIKNRLNEIYQMDSSKKVDQIKSLETEVMYLKKSISDKSQEIEHLHQKNTLLTRKLDNEKNSVKKLNEKICFLTTELNSKFNSKESQTIAYQLGESIIDGLKNPKEGIKRAPSTSAHLIKESIRRRAKKKNANKIDKILSIVFEPDAKSLETKKNGTLGTDLKNVGYTSKTPLENKKEIRSSILKVEDKIQNKPKNQINAISEDKDQFLVLGKEPIWKEVDVNESGLLVIEGASKYNNIDSADDKHKAVILVKSFDVNGKELDKPCGKMVKSKALNSYFKYLPNTKGQVKNLHQFEVPKKVKLVKIGLCSFNIKEGEEVLVAPLGINLLVKEDVEFKPPSSRAADISVMGWPDYPFNNKPYVLGIMDEFTTGCFENEVNLIQPRPDNWYALAEKYKPVLIFIESAWKGNYGSWQYRVGNYNNKPGREVENICQYARDKGIPTLFWNKEDPVHHNKFMVSARLVDYIYTTDANMKESYKQQTGNSNVKALPFAAQPALHKPAPLLNRKPYVCFAGSWYGNRHAERGESMRWLLQAANNYGLHIYDRNYGTGNFPFPEQFERCLKGSLPYKELSEEYRRYRVFLNVNSVTNSPTMFSRRVFELMASGTPVVSTYAQGIEELFESGAVWLVNSQEEANDAIRTLMTDDDEWRRRSLLGIREVFSKHTYAHRLNSIFEDMQLENHIEVDPKVAIFARANNKDELSALKCFIEIQDYQNFDLIVESSITLDRSLKNLPLNVHIINLGTAKNWIYNHKHNYSLAGLLDLNDDYGKYYLRDLVNASIYEPEAMGWAKSCFDDLFSYSDEAYISATLFKVDKFIEHDVGIEVNEYRKFSNVFIIDSDEFKARNSTKSVLGDV